MSTAAAFNSMATAYGIAYAAMMPDTVTFNRPTNATDTVGGVTTTTAATTPANVPCRWRPMSSQERTVADSRVSGTGYVIFVPNMYSSVLIDVDAKCTATIAARSGGDAARTFETHGIARYEGLEIKIEASFVE